MHADLFTWMFVSITIVHYNNKKVASSAHIPKMRHHRLTRKLARWPRDQSETARGETWSVTYIYSLQHLQKSWATILILEEQLAESLAS